jgi:para-nitrobenzyl esterase
VIIFLSPMFYQDSRLFLRRVELHPKQFCVLFQVTLKSWSPNIMKNKIVKVGMYRGIGLFCYTYCVHYRQRERTKMSHNDNTLIETKSGRIKGAFEEDLYVFKGIPFAAPPVGKFRWLSPQPVLPWKGTRESLTFGPIAPQIGSTSGPLQESPVDETQSEDCLYLNVWSPGLDDTRRPVMVWIHGGAFKLGSGSSPTYSGANLAKRGNVVVVTINYRLGPLGFLHLKNVTGGRIPATGNEGLLDQITALQWVRDNIASFGGNPDNVTVFGESAGAMSVGCLLAMPQARGLFHKAILQSGANTVKHLEEAIQLTEQLLIMLGLRTGDVDAIRALTVERLLAAQQELGVNLNIKGSILEPVVDGETLPELPIDAVRRGSADKIAILAGSNLEEAKFMARMDQGLIKIDDAGLVRRWQRVLPADLVPGLIEDYRKAMSQHGRDNSTPELALALQTDVQFRIPAIRLVEAQSRHNLPSYSYLFTWKSPVPALGACHTLEVGFVFGNLTAPFNGTGPAADKLADTMQEAWLAFARNGNPGCEILGNWPQYGNRRFTMVLGKECYLAEAPYDAERRAWDSIPNKFLG